MFACNTLISLSVLERGELFNNIVHMKDLAFSFYPPSLSREAGKPAAEKTEMKKLLIVKGWGMIDKTR